VLGVKLFLKRGTPTPTPGQKPGHTLAVNYRISLDTEMHINSAIIAQRRKRQHTACGM